MFTLVAHGLLGLVSGRLVDTVNGKLRTSLPLTRLPSVVLQLAVAALLPTLLLQLGFTGFVDSWQTTTAGLFFASMYMGMQSSVYSTMQT